MLAAVACLWGREVDNGRDGEFLLLGVIEEIEHVVADDDAGLSAKHTLGHDGLGMVKKMVSVETSISK